MKIGHGLCARTRSEGSEIVGRLMVGMVEGASIRVERQRGGGRMFET